MNFKDDFMRREEKEEMLYRQEGECGCVQEPVVAYDVQASKRQGAYTVQDYYNLPEDVRAELIDGVIYYMSAPTSVHQIIAVSLCVEIRKYIEKKGGNCLSLLSPIDVRLDCDDKTMVQPDLLILCDKDKLRRWGIMGAPDFVLEVLSESTRRKDSIKKVVKYADAGVKEYWIIDPKYKKLLVYDFTDDNYPVTYTMDQTVGVALYHGELQIDLKEISELIQEYPD